MFTLLLKSCKVKCHSSPMKSITFKLIIICDDSLSVLLICYWRKSTIFPTCNQFLSYDRKMMRKTRKKCLVFPIFSHTFPIRRGICYTRLSLYMVANLLANLGWFDFDLGCSTVLPTCSTTSANFPSAPDELGRGRNSTNQSQPNPGSAGDGPPFIKSVFSRLSQGLEDDILESNITPL